MLRLARENPAWGYRRIHGELLTLGITLAASTVWQILRDADIDPAPERGTTTWAAFLCSQAQCLFASTFFETVTLTGTKMYVVAVIETRHPPHPHPRRHRPPHHRVTPASPSCTAVSAYRRLNAIME